MNNNRIETKVKTNHVKQLIVPRIDSPVNEKLGRLTEKPVKTDFILTA